MNLLKRLCLVMCALLLCMFAIGAVAVHNRDLSEHRERIQQLVTDKTGREFQIRGDLRAALFPRPGISLHDVWMADAGEFGNEAFARVDVANIFFQLLPLITGTFEPTQLAMHGLQLNLQRNAEGRLNWDDLMARSSLVESRSDEQMQQELETGLPVAALLALDQLQISAGELRWVDELSGDGATLSGLRLDAGPISVHQPLHVDAAMDLAIDGHDMVTGIAAAGDMQMGLLENRYTLKLNKFNTVSSSDERPMAQINGSASGEFSVDLSSQRLRVQNFRGRIADMSVNVDLTMTRILEDPVYSGQFTASDIDVVNLLVDNGYRIPNGFNSRLLRNASVAGHIQSVRDDLHISELHMLAGDLNVSAGMQVANWRETPVYSGTFKSQHFNPRLWLKPWLQLLGSDLQHEAILGSAQVRGTFRRAGRLLALNSIELQLDNSLTTGDIEIADAQQNTPLRFELKTDDFSADRFFDIRTTDALNGDSILAGLKKIQSLADRLPVQGQWEFDKFNIAGLELKNLRLPVEFSQQRLMLTEVASSLYSGSMHTTLSADTLSAEKQLSLNFSLNGFEIEPLVSRMVRIQSPLSGVGNVSFDYHARAEQDEELLLKAGGAVNINLSNVTVHPVDLAAELTEIANDIDNATVPLVSTDTDQPRGSHFEDIRFSGVLNAGRLSSEQLSFDSRLLKVSGVADLELPGFGFDSAVTTTISPDIAVGQPGLRPVAGLQIPMRLRGVLPDNNPFEHWLSQWRINVTDALRNPPAVQESGSVSSPDSSEKPDDTGDRNAALDLLQVPESQSISEAPSEAPIAAALPPPPNALPSAQFNRELSKARARFGEALDADIQRELRELLND